MMGHKICFYEEIWLIIPKLSLLLLLICSTESSESFIFVFAIRSEIASYKNGLKVTKVLSLYKNGRKIYKCAYTPK